MEVAVGEICNSKPERVNVFSLSGFFHFRKAYCVNHVARQGNLQFWRKTIRANAKA